MESHRPMKMARSKSFCLLICCQKGARLWLFVIGCVLTFLQVRIARSISATYEHGEKKKDKRDWIQGKKSRGRLGRSSGMKKIRNCKKCKYWTMLVVLLIFYLRVNGRGCVIRLYVQPFERSQKIFLVFRADMEKNKKGKFFGIWFVFFS